jgi:hypothetical protein
MNAFRKLGATSKYDQTMIVAIAIKETKLINRVPTDPIDVIYVSCINIGRPYVMGESSKWSE